MVLFQLRVPVWKQCKIVRLYKLHCPTFSSSNTMLYMPVSLTSFHRTSLFLGFHEHLAYAIDCFAHERVINMDVSIVHI